MGAAEMVVCILADMRSYVWTGLLMLCCAAVGAQTVKVSFPAARSAAALDGRVLLLLSNDASAEPRMQIDDTPRSQMVFGVTVDGLKPGVPVAVGDGAAGYPVARLKDVPPGEYTVQAVLNVYETFHRGGRQDGEAGAGPRRRAALEPGSGKPVLDAAQGTRRGRAPDVSVVLDQVIPPIPPEEDTKWVKHLRIQSALLTKFWGRPMFLSAIVLLPDGFDAHPRRTIR